MTRTVVVTKLNNDFFWMKNHLVLDYITVVVSHGCLCDPGIRFDILLFSSGFTLKSEEYSAYSYFRD